MGTRSRIAVMHGTVCKSVYCHWDGYLAHNGRILQEHYDSARANQLVAMGDISSLGPKIGEQHPFSKFEIATEHPNFEEMMSLHQKAESEGWTTFYNRDRGESNTNWKVSHNFHEFLEQVENCGAEYYYVMENGQWYVGSTYGDFNGRLVLLSEALEAEKETV
jgi:hypothetical protein